MSGPIDPVRKSDSTRRVSERRGEERRAAERRGEAAENAVPPAPETGRPRGKPGPRSAPAAPDAFSAQLLGQGGEKRGLRGGPPVLEGARSAYLEAEFLGPKDRRTRKGRITRTEI